MTYNLSPRSLLVTALVFIVYLILWLSTTLIQAGPPQPLSHDAIRARGLDLDIATQDLQAVASASHPYNSRQNEAVHTYILNRVQPLADQHDFIEISVDADGGAYWFDDNALNYFESTNILVKIQGQRDDLKGVMFASHYDSVATSHGTTDNGIGVVTLIQLVHYFAAHRPKRTVLLNFNNGEEDGLLGAHAFLLHPWAQLVKPFMNLEGSGSGGRPIVFRTSSHRLTKAFRSLSHTHGSALSSDAFSIGLIRSRTDFSVYNMMGMGGIDMAFYQRRNRYHSMDDTIESLDQQGSIGGGRNGSIWAMLGNAWEAGLALTEDEDPRLGEIADPAIYFDIFGRGMAVFTLDSVFAVNVALLVLGPILITTVYALLLRSSRYRCTAEWIAQSPFRGWGRFLLSFLICLVLTIGFALVHSARNPFIVASHPNIVFLCLFALAICALCVPLYIFSFARPLPSPAPFARQSSQMFISVYVLWWILLLVYTILLRVRQIGGLYFFTFYNAFALVSVLIDLGAEMLYVWLAAKQTPVTTSPDPSDKGSIPKEVQSQAAAGNNVLSWFKSLHDKRESLVQKERLALANRYQVDPSKDLSDRYGLWIAQLMISLPFPVLLVMQLCLLLVVALGHTIADGSSPMLVYLLTAVLVICIVMPLAPFAHRLHPVFFLCLFLIFFSTVIYNNVTFPFSTTHKFKTFWYQQLDLGTGVNTVKLIGVERYLKQIPPTIPSASSQLERALGLSDDPIIKGLKASYWQGPVLNVVADMPNSSWLNASVQRLNATSAQFSIRGAESKQCRITFNKNVNGLTFPDTAFPSAHPYFPIRPSGSTVVNFWTRTATRDINATVTWDPQLLEDADEIGLVNSGQNVPRRARVGCYYSDITRGKLPALDELFDYAPKWVAVTGNRPMVEVFREFDV